MTRRRAAAVAALPLALVALPSTASGQPRVGDAGVVLGVRLGAVPAATVHGLLFQWFSYDPEATAPVYHEALDGGVAYGATIGYELNTVLALHVRADRATIRGERGGARVDHRLDELSATVRATSPVGVLALRPFVAGGAAALGLKETSDPPTPWPGPAKLFGSGFVLGAGVTRTLLAGASLDAAVEFVSGRYDRAVVGMGSTGPGGVLDPNGYEKPFEGGKVRSTRAVLALQWHL
jgi:hypothetical protein